MVFENCGNCIAMEQSGYIIYIVSKRTVWEAKIMKKITSAYANKMLRSLEEDKAFWVNKEAASSTYVAAVNEEPVIPEYDYYYQTYIEPDKCHRKSAGWQSGDEH